MNKSKLIIYLILLCGFCLPAEAGVGKEVIKQGVKILCRKALKETSEELSESAAKKLVREAMKHSDDVAKLAKEFGEEGLVQIVKSPAARRMCSEVGDQATVAILKHGDLAVEMLTKAPKGSAKGVAAALSKIERRSTVRRMASAARKGGEDAMAWVAKHPKLAAAGAIGAFLLANPTARAITDAILSAIWNHPILTSAAILVIIAAVWFLWKIYLPILIDRLRRRLSGAKKDARPQDSPTPKDAPPGDAGSDLPLSNDELSETKNDKA